MPKRNTVKVKLMPSLEGRTTLAYEDYAPGITIFNAREHPDYRDADNLWFFVHTKSGQLISERWAWSFSDAKYIATVLSKITDWQQELEDILKIDGLESAVDHVIMHKKLKSSDQEFPF